MSLKLGGRKSVDPDVGEPLFNAHLFLRSGDDAERVPLYGLGLGFLKTIGDSRKSGVSRGQPPSRTRGQESE